MGPCAGGAVYSPAITDFVFFFHAEDGIRDGRVTGVQTCALPIFWGIASTEDPDQAMPQIIETICTGFGWECGSHWSLDKDGALLRCSTSWGEKAPAIWEFLALTKRMSAPNGVDLPGRAWANRELLFVKNIASEQGFSRAAAAQQASLHGALALPIIAGGRVFGVIELFSAEPVQPDEAL